MNKGFPHDIETLNTETGTQFRLFKIEIYDNF